MKKFDHFFWDEQIKQLPVLSQNCNSYKELINVALQNIVESLSLKRATYLCCVLEEGRIDYNVTAETFPKDRDFITRKSSELTLLLMNIILENANERYMEQTFAVENEEINVKVFQIRLSEHSAQHILVLTAAQPSIEGLQLSDDDKKAGLKYLAQLVKTAASRPIVSKLASGITAIQSAEPK
jgi:hypothetical protein